MIVEVFDNLIIDYLKVHVRDYKGLPYWCLATGIEGAMEQMGWIIIKPQEKDHEIKSSMTINMYGKEVIGYWSLTRVNGEWKMTRTEGDTINVRNLTFLEKFAMAILGNSLKWIYTKRGY